MGLLENFMAEKQGQAGVMPQSVYPSAAPEPEPIPEPTLEPEVNADETSADPPALGDDEPLPDGEADSENEDEPEPATEPEKTAPTDDMKKAEHEAAEAKRKAEWDAKQAAKKAAEEKILRELETMTDDEIVDASVKRTGSDLEKLTRRNMKMCVTEHIQTKCLDDPAFARLTYHPKKNMINCFKYINKKAEEFVKKELEMLGQKAIGTVGEDVPDDLCYQWAEDYFRDADAEVDKDKDDIFVPKTYYGGSSSAKAKAKKEPAKPKKEAPPEKKPAPAQEQGGLFTEAAA